MTQEFKTGDIVQLKSGGPKMTVTEVKDFMGELHVYCTWFAGAKNEHNSFPPDALVPIEEEPKA